MMKMSIRKISVAILMASAMSLTACGGGGGGGGGSTSTSGGGSLAVTSANGRQVAAASFDAFASSTGGNRATLGATGAEITGSSESSAGLAELLHGEILRALDEAQPSTVTGATFGPFECTFGDSSSGTFTFDFNDANGNGLIDLNESITITYDNCDFGASFTETFNGTFTLVFTAASPSVSEVGLAGIDWSYTATLTFTNFSITDKSTGETETLDSNMTITANFDNSSGETATTLVGSFEVTNSDGTVAISNYQYSVVLLPSGGLYTDATIEGRATIGSLGGDVIMSTPEPLDNLSSAFIWPEFGTLRAAATEGSGFVELDANTGDEETVTVTTNDGSTATAETVNWADL